MTEISSATARPRLAITMGDVTGIGPEITAMSLARKEIYQLCQPLVIGDWAALERAVALCAPQLGIRTVTHPDEGQYQAGSIDLLALSQLAPADQVYGHPTPASGAKMVEFILKAVDLALSGEVAAVVTGPISKAAMHLAGYDYPGHTELLAERTGAAEMAMMLAGDGFRVVLATIHCPLVEVASRLNTTALVRLITLTHRSLRVDFGLSQPRIGVAALNPHASEGGLFGTEEAAIISPAIEQAQTAGIPVTGPFPADTLFVRQQRGEFDAVVAMYHDQGLIPLKLLYFGRAVNITLGLPIVRTSVDHGTAYDLAGTGQADPGSLKAAIRLAALIAENRARNN
ncbi:MAG: 4-hydroxythreonine-4-phosphate dehydrogenase PdxA [Desulfobacca sp. 4484_104]|nr:MAG: 4-hydroxythreonine-4-phosphate dehydrogenase PdxA [Desulfobacca sp. 4484_104]RLA89471.1 MAG: 4-hydroxythreonine-4-phosphate dehydrogenase PdxA [Deltaproteobacteria bacterium]